MNAAEYIKQRNDRHPYRPAKIVEVETFDCGPVEFGPGSLVVYQHDPDNWIIFFSCDGRVFEHRDAVAQNGSWVDVEEITVV